MTTAAMGLVVPGASGESVSASTAANNALLEAHDHLNHGASIANAVASYFAAAGTAGTIADAVKAIIEANAFSFPYADMQGVTKTISAGLVTVPFATDLDQSTVKGHFTSAAALTGTVAKTSGSNAVVGTGTAFLSELSVGQLISIPGTAAELCAVVTITDDTHITVSKNLANTATGQTATRVNDGYVCRKTGRYAIRFAAGLTAVSAGTRTLEICNNDTLIPGAQKIVPIAAASLAEEVTVYTTLTLWDIVQPKINTDEATSPFVTPTLSVTFMGLA